MRFWLAATRGGCPLAFVGQVAAATATNQTALDSGVHRLRWESLNSSFAHFLHRSCAWARDWRPARCCLLVLKRTGVCGWSRTDGRVETENRTGVSNAGGDTAVH